MQISLSAPPPTIADLPRRPVIQSEDCLNLPREDNLEAPVHLKPILPPASLPVILGRFDHDKGIIHALVSDAAMTAQRLIVDAGQHRFMVVRTGEGLKAYSAACPHYGIDLADGGSDESVAYCPACAIGFDLKTGRSACGTFVLQSCEVWEAGAAIMLKISSQHARGMPTQTAEIGAWPLPP